MDLVSQKHEDRPGEGWTDRGSRGGRDLSDLFNNGVPSHRAVFLSAHGRVCAGEEEYASGKVAFFTLD